MFPCVDCEFLFDKLPVIVWIYSIAARRVCLLHLRSNPLARARARHPGIFRASADSPGEFVCLKRKRESTFRCSLRPEVHPAINHTVLLIVLKLCHAASRHPALSRGRKPNFVGVTIFKGRYKHRLYYLSVVYSVLETARENRYPS